jgi:hypothetical protein
VAGLKAWQRSVGAAEQALADPGDLLEATTSLSLTLTSHMHTIQPMSFVALQLPPASNLRRIFQMDPNTLEPRLVGLVRAMRAHSAFLRASLDLRPSHNRVLTQHCVLLLFPCALNTCLYATTLLDLL